MVPEHTASREELAALLWGDCSDQQARQSLRQALAVLRKEIGNPAFLAAEGDLIRFNVADWTADIWDFEAFARSADPDHLAEAARLFTGDVMAGLNIDEDGFRDWLGVQRTKWQNALGSLCNVFATRPELVSDPHLAIATIDRLLGFDPLREDWQRLAIICSARYSGKAEALRRAAQFAEALKSELGVAPERETRELLEQIRSQETAPHAAPPVIETVPTPPSITVVAPDLHTPEPEIALTAIPIPSPDASAPRRRWKRPSGTAILRGAIAAVAIIAAVIAIEVDDLDPIKPLFGAIGTHDPRTAQLDSWRSPADRAQTQAKSDLIPIAILPFAVVGGGDDTLQLRADMLTDDLTIMMSRLPSFRVISRQTARSFQGQVQDVARIGTELQVRYILEGSVRLQEDLLRVNVELINPVTRQVIWSDRVDRDGTDRQGVRDEIVGRIARELQFDLMPIEGLRLSKNVDAGALAYRGWAAMSAIDAGSYSQALGLFQQALQREPQNLSAQIGLGAYHARMGAQMFDNDSTGHRKEAIRILRQILKDAPDSSSAHYYLGLALNKLPTLPESMEHLRRTIEINPSDASAYGQIGNGLIRSGKPAEGLDYVRYAMRLSPRDPVMPVWLEFAGNAELERGDYNAAIAYFQRSATLSPTYPRALAGLVAAYALQGQKEASERLAEKLKQLAPKLDANQLVKQFGRQDGSRLHAGLEVALAPHNAPLP